ncbi:hypothetical protein CYMTET_30796 [Cymbomonas tetramitiformis]|uniref:Uncharacterized protein n=1 Tax=Cymbomonas tetramitiformis TaxID=36881 RepID=A0AAE0FIG8_9CHLO|nr:hypothetical protein CYMTET_30796 [Cymbomonas tetramitiformis]
MVEKVKGHASCVYMHYSYAYAQFHRKHSSVFHGSKYKLRANARPPVAVTSQLPMGCGTSKAAAKQATEGTELIAAALRGDVDDLKTLLMRKNSQQQTYRDEEGYIALHWAGRYDRPDIIRLLLENDGSLLEHRSVPEEHTALHLAAYFGCPEAARTLLDLMAHLEAKDKDGRTALHLAAYNGQTEMVNLLLTKNAKLEAKNTLERGPLHLAAYHGSVETIQALLQAGAQMNVADSEGRIPLHLASARGNLAAVKVLLEVCRAATPKSTLSTCVRLPGGRVLPGRCTWRTAP